MKGNARNRIGRIDIDDSALPPPTPEMEQDRRVAVFDLLHGRTPPAERAALVAATLAAPVARRVRRKLTRTR